MTFWSRLRRSNFFIKLFSWEYWPFGILQAPLFPYWLWLSLKARSLVFFTASNPGIVMGGMFGESKFDVLKLVPDQWKPNTILIKRPCGSADVARQLREAGLQFPLIFKPDIGERGLWVKKIHSERDIQGYLDQMPFDFLAQAFVPLPFEFGVFYVRYPSQQTGRVTSIVGKEMLSVTGDGKSTLRDLILSFDRAKLQWEKLERRMNDRLHEVPAAGTRVELVSVGNHCLGTKFLNCNHLITPELSAAFDNLAKQIPGFYFGRFDLRAASLDDLQRGQVMIMELNGCGAEPAHIYDPNFSFTTAIRVLFKHWSDIYQISRENHKRGTPYLSLQEARTYYRYFKLRTASTE